MFARQIDVVAALTLMVFSVAVGADKTNRARDLARQALKAEIVGDTQQRRSLLAEASAASPNEPLVRWQLGQVRVGNGWKTYDDLQAEAKSSRLLQKYRELRDASEPTLNSQLQLAKFCQKNGLKEQAQAHWSAVLELEPDHTDARQHLGFEKQEGRWIQRAEVVSEREHAKLVANALRQLTPELKGLATQLDAGSLTVVDGIAKLQEHATPAAIPAWESIVSTKCKDGAQAVIGALAGMSDPAASLSLARHALSSSWPDARAAAIDALRKRDENSYVPALLAELRGPWIGWREMTTDGGNRLVCRFVVVADGADQQALRVLDQAYFLHGDRSLANVLAAQSAAGTSADLDLRRQRANIEINAYNDRIMQLLAELTGEMAFDSPQDWWQWWDDRNEVYSAAGKPIETSYAFRSTSIVALPPPTPAPTNGVRREIRDTTKDCLAGGTLVLTQRGPVAVERIRLGDLVLAQHPETGELALRPVLRTTMREPEQLVHISLEAETVRASGGHPFWVSGQGWVRARQLQPGMRLHGLDQSTEIRAVAVEEKATRTFNLVVADFHTFFNGPGKVLSHDNSTAAPTHSRVPGLSE